MAQSKFIQSVLDAAGGRPKSTQWYKDKIKEFVNLANKDFSSLTKKYGLDCKNLVENPEQRTIYWENKGKKLIK